MSVSLSNSFQFFGKNVGNEFAIYNDTKIYSM